mgnify:FL=1
MIGLRKAALLATSIAVMGLVTGCGIESDSDPMANGATGGDATVANANGGNTGSNKVISVAAPTKRQTGVIRVEGKSQGSLTEQIANGYESGGGASRVDITNTSENAGFSDFCAGDVDVVDSARPISPKEFKKCQRNGIQPVQFRVASDAAILAIKNETDVGVDCLAFDEVRQMYQSGSSINSWSEVGYNRDLVDVRPIRMKFVGPGENSNVFSFFGQYVLGDPEPTLLSYRTDYQAKPTDREVRQTVVGTKRNYFYATQYKRYRKGLRQLRSSISDGKPRVADAKAEVAKGIRDGRSPEAKAKDQANLDAAQKNLDKLLASVPPAKRSAKLSSDAKKRVERALGTIGLFRFSYYELFEEQLRPMEVSASDNADKPECVFPSQATVTDASYPLARQLLLTINYKNMKDSDINDFLSYGLSRSQALAEKSALVPIPDSTRNEEQGWLDGTSEPDVVFYSSGNAS